MDNKASDSLKTTRVSEWTVNQGGYLPVVFGSLLIFGCITAYVIAVLRGNVNPILPLISDAAGSPPQNGIFGTLICFGGMLGIVFVFLRYLIVAEQNQEKSRTVNVLNKLSVAMGICSMFGITLITGYPANFYRDKDVWLKHVGIPHMLGGVVLFSSGLIYTALQCILTLYLRSKHKFMLFLRICLCLAATAAFVHHVVTVPDNFGQIKIGSHTALDLQESNGTVTQMPPRDLRLNIDMNGTYIPSAISQWLLMLLFSCFFFTFFGEVQEYSLLIVVETSNPDLDANDEVAIDDYDEKDGPSTYTRKTSHAFGNFPTGVSYDGGNRKNSTTAGTRRDSSCQTREEMFPQNGSCPNGNSKVDERAGSTEKLLEPKNGSVETENVTEANGVKEKNGHLGKPSPVTDETSGDKVETVVPNENKESTKTE